MKQILLNILATSLETIGESKLKEVLKQLFEKNPAQYKVAILGGIELVNALTPLVTRTGTKIDDAIIKALKEALEQSAKENGLGE